MKRHWIEELHGGTPGFHAYKLRAALGEQNDCYVDIELWRQWCDGDGSHWEQSIDGHIKWDGCANFSHCEDGAAHFCGTDSIEEYGRMLRRLFTMARALMPKANWEEPV